MTSWQRESLEENDHRALKRSQYVSDAALSAAAQAAPSNQAGLTMSGQDSWSHFTRWNVAFPLPGLD